MTPGEKRDPWSFAVEAKRDYLTPEDIATAIANGAGRIETYEHTLEAISQRKAEDPRLCAFVAVHSDHWMHRGKPSPKRGTDRG